MAGEADGAFDLRVTVAPNPVSGRGTVSFGLAESSDVSVALYDALGRRVAVLAEGPHGLGRHAASLDAGGLPAGVYMVHVTGGAEVQTSRITVVR